MFEITKPPPFKIVWQARCKAEDCTIDLETRLDEKDIDHLCEMINRIGAHEKDDEYYLFYAEVMWTHNTRGKWNYDGPANIMAGADVVIDEEGLEIREDDTYTEEELDDVFDYLELNPGLVYVDDDNIWIKCDDNINDQVYESKPFPIRDLGAAIRGWWERNKKRNTPPGIEVEHLPPDPARGLNSSHMTLPPPYEDAALDPDNEV